jgi:uncharacterized protein (DUF2147 family)
MTRILAGALLVLFAGIGAAAAETPSPIGRWLTEGGKSHVEIYACGTQLCGKIVWLREPLFKDGRPKTDLNNSDKALHSRPIIGLPFLWNFVKASEPGVWEGGRIYNPEDGDTYKATITLRPDGKLALRGYVGISLLGKSQYWERVK